MPDYTKAAIARLIDHTLLAPTATRADIVALVAEAAELGAYSVCVSPSFLPFDSASMPIAAVCGFPSGKHATAIKAAEAKLAVAAGASEIDLVIDVGAAIAGEWSYVRQQIARVREEIGAAVLKVIIESAALTDRQIVNACQSAAAAGADFVKTSTGFHPAGGASVAAVRLMRETVGDQLGVKASGGIRDAATAIAMVEAGANRLGLSATRAVLAGLPD
ncbi:MAG: deoxyribose-phosphate aldolase [Propionibacteriaceae bacterium]|jgi:deoxyribose-phosphate aldolase|nr:deoxyribose-phosphate aldolase [Propionibacteriaceae bacterium]